MLFDTHAHVHDDAFRGETAEVLARAREAGVVALCDIGTDLPTSRKAVALAAAPPAAGGVRIYAAVGIHPHDGDRVDDAAIESLRALAGSPGVVAIGETGLDFYRNKSSREGQERALRAHLGLARDLGLPVVLHLRSSQNAGEGAHDAYAACLRVLDDHRGSDLRGVSHCFSGTPDLARALVERGFHVSFAGNASYPNAEVLREAARAIPLERIVLETDCPYLSPQERRGKRNEPAFIRHTAEAIARARGLSFEEVAAATTANARELFGLPAPEGA